MTGHSEEVVEDEPKQHDPDVPQARGQPQLPGLLVDLDQTFAVAVADVAEPDQAEPRSPRGEHRRPDRRRSRESSNPGLPLELGLMSGRGPVWSGLPRQAETGSSAGG